MTDDNQETVEYVAAGHSSGDAEFDTSDDFADELPPRPRQKLLTPWSALLAALLLGAVGFYVGIRVEKSNGSSTSSATGFAAAAKTGAGGFSAAFKTGKGGAAAFKRGSAAGGFTGAPGAAAAGTSGTVSSIKGHTLYVTETGGNTVKVKLSDATTITKSQTVAKGKVYPGDTVTVVGKSSGGSVAATSVTDSGASTSSSSTSSTSSSGSSSSGSGSVSSLFGSS